MGGDAVVPRSSEVSFTRTRGHLHSNRQLSRLRRSRYSSSSTQMPTPYPTTARIGAPNAMTHTAGPAHARLSHRVGPGHLWLPLAPRRPEAAVRTLTASAATERQQPAAHEGAMSAAVASCSSMDLSSPDYERAPVACAGVSVTPLMVGGGRLRACLWSCDTTSGAPLIDLLGSFVKRAAAFRPQLDAVGPKDDDDAVAAGTAVVDGPADELGPLRTSFAAERG